MSLSNHPEHPSNHKSTPWQPFKNPQMVSFTIISVIIELVCVTERQSVCVCVSVCVVCVWCVCVCVCVCVHVHTAGCRLLNSFKATLFSSPDPDSLY